MNWSDKGRWEGRIEEDKKVRSSEIWINWIDKGRKTVWKEIKI
jgi:hypothetical protein